MLNPHIPSRNEENAQKLKRIFASHARISVEKFFLGLFLCLELFLGF
jgi:hypothetical protein